MQESSGVQNICETKRKTNYYEGIINNELITQYKNEG
jgi:hypothetical protein